MALCSAFETAMRDPELDPLLLIPIFILDFLCIHPFNDGNGRMSRLLTLLLLYRSGYLVGKYISIEKLISDTKETYYEALQASSCNWHEGTNDYAPFVTYMLGVLAAAYRLLRRVEHGQNFRKKDRLHLHRRAELFERHSIQPRGYGCRSLPP